MRIFVYDVSSDQVPANCLPHTSIGPTNTSTNTNSTECVDTGHTQQLWTDRFGDGCNWYEANDPACEFGACCANTHNLSAVDACYICCIGNVPSNAPTGDDDVIRSTELIHHAQPSIERHQCDTIGADGQPV